MTNKRKLPDDLDGCRHVLGLWRTAGAGFTPYPAFPPEIGKVIYSTNMIESINSRLRKDTRNRASRSTGRAH